MMNPDYDKEARRQAKPTQKSFITEEKTSMQHYNCTDPCTEIAKSSHHGSCGELLNVFSILRMDIGKAMRHPIPFPYPAIVTLTVVFATDAAHKPSQSIKKLLDSPFSLNI